MEAHGSVILYTVFHGKPSLSQFPVLSAKKKKNHLPGGRSQSSDECLQQPANENERVLLGDGEVEQRQDNGGVDDQSANHSNGVHSQLAAHGCDVIHLHNLSSDQKQDADRSVPRDR